MQKPDINLLRFFDAVISEGSLTLAAERLGKSQPAVSQAVAKLRRLTGDPLFLPAGRSIRPTQRALDIRESVRTLLDQADQIMSPAPEFDPSNSEREFRLVLHEYAELLILPKLFRRLEDLNSPLRIRTYPWAGDANQRLVRGDVDLCFDTLPADEAHLQSAGVVSEPYMCVMRKGHPCADAIDLQTFLELEHAVLDWPDPHASFIDRWLSKRDLRRKVRVRLYSGAAIMAMVKSSDMICTLSQSMAETLACGGSHKIIPAPLNDLRFVCFLKWHAGSKDDGAHSWLRRAVFDGVPQQGRIPAAINQI